VAPVLPITIFDGIMYANISELQHFVKKYHHPISNYDALIIANLVFAAT
jgi:hypothetical protein